MIHPVLGEVPQVGARNDERWVTSGVSVGVASDGVSDGVSVDGVSYGLRVGCLPSLLMPRVSLLCMPQLLSEYPPYPRGVLRNVLT